MVIVSFSQQQNEEQQQQQNDALEVTLLVGNYSILRFDPASPALNSLFTIMSSPKPPCVSPNSALFNLSVSPKEISLVGPTSALFDSHDQYLFNYCTPQAVEGGWVALRVEPPPSPTLLARNGASSVGVPSDNCASTEKQNEDSSSIFHPPGIDFSVVGIMARISGSLARAGVSLFAISTFDTDYILFKEEKIRVAIRVLHEDGCRVQAEDPDRSQWIETLK